jgi:hypothetical protein
VQYIPTIYGFKIFGQKGSKFELVYDNLGAAKNQKDIDTVLKKKTLPPGIGGSSMGALAQISGASAAAVSSLGGGGQGDSAMQ